MRRALAMLSMAAILASGCGEPLPAPSPPPEPPALFRDSGAESGLTFEHAQSRAHAVRFLPETLGPGVASFDADGDGLQDLFFVQGSGSTDGREPATVPASHLYRAAGGTRFDEVGARAGADLRGWGQAALACDWNNDGYQDLLVTSYMEPVALLTSNGDGTFRTERGPRGGLPGGDRWWSSATALDLDRDGLLDLYLGAYVVFGPAEWVETPPLISFSGMTLPQTMAPSPYAAARNAFLSNRGDGGWVDRTDALNLANADGRTLGALAADLDQDGWTDLFVANDVSPCALFHNVRGMPEDIAGRAFVAESRGSMGLALGDPDRDGAFDIAVSHWVGDYPAFYRSIAPRGRLGYEDAAPRVGLAAGPRDRVGWALTLDDLDNDGHDDALIVNGHTTSASDHRLVAQPPTLLRGVGDGRVQLHVPGPQATGPLASAVVGRGAAFTDVDNDGFEDVAVGVNNGRAELWRNLGGGGHWIGLQLAGTLSNRSAIGGVIDIATSAGLRHAQVTSGESFFSSSDPRVRLGLGSASGASRVRVRWPSGRDESFAGLAADRYHRLIEGTGSRR